MLTGNSRIVADQAKATYEAGLQAQLEASDFGRNVAIEPISREYFLGSSFDEAVNAAIERFS